MPDHNKLHDNEMEFFRRNDRNTLRLSGITAIAACEQAAKQGFSIGRIEGGHWLNPGFESRLDSIWTNKAAPVSQDDVHEDNLKAAEFISEKMRNSSESELPPVNAFILSARKI